MVVMEAYGSGVTLVPDPICQKVWYEAPGDAKGHTLVPAQEELADAYFKGQTSYFSQVQEAYQGAGSHGVCEGSFWANK